MVLTSVLGGGQGAARAVPAAGLVQVTVLGETGYGAVQVEVGDDGRVVAVPLHFGYGTAPHEVATLLAARLAEAGVRVVPPADGGNSLFIDGAERVGVFTAGTFRASLGAVDGGVAALRVVPLMASATDTDVHVVASTASPHDGSRELHSHQVHVLREGGAPGAAAALHESAAKLGWNGERPGGSGWRPVRDKGGRDVVGLSASVMGDGWQLVLEL